MSIQKMVATDPYLTEINQGAVDGLREGTKRATSFIVGRVIPVAGTLVALWFAEENLKIPTGKTITKTVDIPDTYQYYPAVTIEHPPRYDYINGHRRLIEEGFTEIIQPARKELVKRGYQTQKSQIETVPFPPILHTTVGLFFRLFKIVEKVADSVGSVTDVPFKKIDATQKFADDVSKGNLIEATKYLVFGGWL